MEHCFELFSKSRKKERKKEKGSENKGRKKETEETERKEEERKKKKKTALFDKTITLSKDDKSSVYFRRFMEFHNGNTKHIFL